MNHCLCLRERKQPHRPGLPPDCSEKPQDQQENLFSACTVFEYEFYAKIPRNFRWRHRGFLAEALQLCRWLCFSVAVSHIRKKAHGLIPNVNGPNNTVPRIPMMYISAATLNMVMAPVHAVVSRWRRRGASSPAQRKQP